MLSDTFVTLIFLVYLVCPLTDWTLLQSQSVEILVVLTIRAAAVMACCGAGGCISVRLSLT